MKFTVTQDDIDHGIRKSCHNCPLARCMSYALNTSVSILSEPDGYSANWDLQWKMLPPLASEWIESFDRGLCPAPIEFILDIENIG